MHEQLSATVIVFTAAIGALLSGIAAVVVPDSVAMNEVAASVQASLNAQQVPLPQAVPAIDPLITKTVPVRINIIDDGKLRMWCLVGAIGGSIAGVCIFGWKNAKDLGLKIVGSSLLGMMFTPGLMRVFEISPEVDMVLISAPCVAIFGTAILKMVFPAVVWTARTVFARTFNLQFPPDEPSK